MKKYIQCVSDMMHKNKIFVQIIQYKNTIFKHFEKLNITLKFFVFEGLRVKTKNKAQTLQTQVPPILWGARI